MCAWGTKRNKGGLSPALVLTRHFTEALHCSGVSGLGTSHEWNIPFSEASARHEGLHVHVGQVPRVEVPIEELLCRRLFVPQQVRRVGLRWTDLGPILIEGICGRTGPEGGAERIGSVLDPGRMESIPGDRSEQSHISV